MNKQLLLRIDHISSENGFSDIVNDIQLIESFIETLSTIDKDKLLNNKRLEIPSSSGTTLYTLIKDFS